jgi:hypothetical protein
MSRKLLVGAIAAGALTLTAGTAFALTGDNGATTTPSGAVGITASLPTSTDDTPTSSSLPTGTESTGSELSADDAAGIALARYGGTVHEVERELEHGRLEWKVEIVAADGTEYDVRVDAQTGAVTRADQDDRDDHGRHGDDDDN